ncbi:MAG TPA: Crp/Fnr family transcriptional regulator, partial [Longimicrobiales bacterium]|nr:Crp/Fnr family transcriptional regulator [Longimicrobiales bacterium]
MASDGRHGERNRLLLALSGAEYERLLPSLEALSIPAGRVLHQTHQAITAVYFPQRCVVSMFMAGDDGESVEVQTVGNEGIVGLGAFLGDRTGFARTVARVPDHAMKMSVVAFRRAVRGTPSLRRILFQYTQTVLATLSRTSLCHRLHRLEARCAHSLLTTQDRVGADRFLLTQSSLAQMVGARRPSIASAAVGLRRAGLIQYSRGRLTIVDRAGLEAASCSCYGIQCADYERL